ncbi:MAG: hypothetical protein CVU81_03380 [Euryarchaeota archaeon HGW-Euryarchaeota-1]|nr:MAG: hypothetical protein CVU81_03380 [Euryarchaeota archaeon HGW-Euryarchaeota-1]
MVTHTTSGLDDGEKIVAEKLLENMLEKLERKTKLSDIKMHFKKYSEASRIILKLLSGVCKMFFIAPTK